LGVTVSVRSALAGSGAGPDADYGDAFLRLRNPIVKAVVPLPVSPGMGAAPVQGSAVISEKQAGRAMQIQFTKHEASSPLLISSVIHRSAKSCGRGFGPHETELWPRMNTGAHG
jgi:hypothetical protein